MNESRIVKNRIQSIDLLRGLVMIIMALDHTRDFFHWQANIDQPMNLATTTPLLFFTRWITHFCAPTFVFLSGTSAWFQSIRKSKKELSSFLIKRGIWLIAIDFIVINFIFDFDVHFGFMSLQTLWAIGISMVFLGLVIWLPFKMILSIGLLIVLGHNSLDFYEAHTAHFGVLYSFFHHPDQFNLGSGHKLEVLYPFLPWTGLIMLGYCFGKIFTTHNPDVQRKIFTFLGVGIVLFFIVLRAVNIYGDPHPWTYQKNGLFTVLSFLKNNKYPPSLLYMCMTIGPSILFLAFAGTIKNKLAKAIIVYGRVPFFYYILHFFLIHFLCMLLFLTRGHTFSDGLNLPPHDDQRFVIPGEGYSLGVVYLIWILIILVTYPLCKWYDRYKTSHKEKWWLSYI